MSFGGLFISLLPKFVSYTKENRLRSISRKIKPTKMTTIGKDAANPNFTTPNDMYVKLVSSDEHEFYVKRDLALTSQTIKAMLSGPGQYFVSSR